MSPSAAREGRGGRLIGDYIALLRSVDILNVGGGWGAALRSAPNLRHPGRSAKRVDPGPSRWDLDAANGAAGPASPSNVPTRLHDRNSWVPDLRALAGAPSGMTELGGEVSLELAHPTPTLGVDPGGHVILPLAFVRRLGVRRGGAVSISRQAPIGHEIEAFFSPWEEEHRRSGKRFFPPRSGGSGGGGERQVGGRSGSSGLSGGSSPPPPPALQPAGAGFGGRSPSRRFAGEVRGRDGSNLGGRSQRHRDIPSARASSAWRGPS
jgi:hypothetical protein